MLNKNIAIKFPPLDIEMMDTLINSGRFISRSDLIREGTRQLINKQVTKKTDKEIYVEYMAKTGTFKDPSLNVIAKLHIHLANSPEKAINNLSKNELKILQKLLRHPFSPVKKLENKFYLTKNGIDLAEGFLDGLLHLKNMII